MNKDRQVQVSMSTDFLRQYGMGTTYFAFEERARQLGEAIAAHYNLTGKIVSVEVTRGYTNYGSSDTDTEWFRISYLNGKDKNVIKSTRGNFNDYAGMKRLWGLYESGRLSEYLA